MEDELKNTDENQEPQVKEQMASEENSEMPSDTTTEVASDVSAELDDVLGLNDDEEETDTPSENDNEAEAVEPEVVKPAKPAEPETKWYSLRVISGKERKIKERIDLEISRNNWGDFVRSIIVPTEKVYKIRNGKKMISERNILPGYMMVEAVADKFSGEMITAIANTPNVIHFLGKGNPIPMRNSEALKLLGKVDDSSELGEQMVEPYIVGETIKIVDGPFNEFVGDVLEINDDKKKMKVMVKIFGRGTEVELNYTQVEKQQ